ncbi:recombinase family protein [Brevibacillus parabrevis]|uniref:recombinase family protein n=1 Tax=Brevibacillus parabrevis TaxID=54914 RepID=UPI001C246AD0|nr:recombinase family protein [Brevibacillus parabrevis]MBU8715404.1 recombinase family protein [Brevibacillus parabrevis]
MGTENTRKEFEQLRRQFAEDMPDTCQNCGSTDDLHIHHIVPLALGGRNIRSNLASLCGVCHGKVHGINIRESHGKAVKAGRIKAARPGRWGAGKVPYGYDVDRFGELVVNEEEAQVIRLMYKWRYIDSLTWPQIRNILREMAIPTKTNGAWSNATLKRIFENPLYRGEYYLQGEFIGNMDEPLLALELIEAEEKFRSENPPGANGQVRVFRRKTVRFGYKAEGGEPVGVGKRALA